VDRAAGRKLASRSLCRIACRRRAFTKNGTSPSSAPRTGDYLDLVTGRARGGKTSRLYKRLSMTSKSPPMWPPTSISGNRRGSCVGSRDGGNRRRLARVERAIDAELARSSIPGRRRAKLRRVKTQSRANFIRGIERIGGFGGKIGRAGGERGLRRQRRPLPGDAAAHRRRHRRDLGRHRRAGSPTATGHSGSPYPTFETAASGADRHQAARGRNTAEARFPAIARATLRTGSRSCSAERHSIPR